MSEILARISRGERGSWYLILDCGHWYHWIGGSKPPKVNEELRCPKCTPLPTVQPEGAK